MELCAVLSLLLAAIFFAGVPPQGIVRVTRHPFLTGVGLWALVHLIGDGDVASLVFFAVWAVVALAGTVARGDFPGRLRSGLASSGR
jgi:uncharacterized membrane protein